MTDDRGSPDADVETDGQGNGAHWGDGASGHVGGREYWDALAKPFWHYDRISAYAADFIDGMRLRPGETVLDMGCGSGTLAIPLHDMGHHVTGVDFSPKMLESVRDVIDAEGISGIDLVEASWEDDWDSAGIPVCDLAVASRSLWGDVGDGVRKLDSRAVRRVCLTVEAAPSMFQAPGLARCLGRDALPPSGHLEAVIAAAMDLGRQPEVSYIRSRRIDVYGTRELVMDHLEKRIGGLAGSERGAFEEYCSLHVVEHAGAGGEADGWYCDDGTESAWAFVSWDKDPYDGCRIETRYHGRDRPDSSGG